MEAKPITRLQRRARRLKRLSAARQAHRAALRAGLDYRVSGENGALTVHTHSLTWHRVKNPNIAIPPEGRPWDRSGRARVAQDSEGGITKSVNQNNRSKQTAASATLDKTE